MGWWSSVLEPVRTSLDIDAPKLIPSDGSALAQREKSRREYEKVTELDNMSFPGVKGRCSQNFEGGDAVVEEVTVKLFLAG